jgi:hypothetical protein
MNSSASELLESLARNERILRDIEDQRLLLHDAYVDLQAQDEEIDQLSRDQDREFEEIVRGSCESELAVRPQKWADIRVNRRPGF